MDFFRGQVVRSRAGHDQGLFFVVLAVDGLSAWICDGRVRRLEKPKRKSLKHLCPTRLAVPDDHLKTDRQIRTWLRETLAGRA